MPLLLRLQGSVSLAAWCSYTLQAWHPGRPPRKRLRGKGFLRCSEIWGSDFRQLENWCIQIFHCHTKTWIIQLWTCGCQTANTQAISGWNKNKYPLVICYIAIERSTNFDGKIHYVYGHFQWQTVCLPEGHFMPCFKLRVLWISMKLASRMGCWSNVPSIAPGRLMWLWDDLSWNPSPLKPLSNQKAWHGSLITPPNMSYSQSKHVKLL